MSSHILGISDIALYGTVGAIVVILGLIIAAQYNGLVRLRNQFKNAYSQIDVLLKRRYDLIPNLVETAKGYMAHERETLEAVIKARSQAASARERVSADPANAAHMQDLMKAETGLSGVLGRLFALQENYPDLKANENMLQLQEELVSTENKISFGRQHYNDQVMLYNTKRESFPVNIIAGLFGFRSASHFEVSTPEERENVKVSF